MQYFQKENKCKVSEGERTERVLDVIMAGNVLNLMNYVNLQIQESQ